jgi:hypothetical protein
MYVITTASLNADIRLRPATATSKIVFASRFRHRKPAQLETESEKVRPASLVVDHAVPLIL